MASMSMTSPLAHTLIRSDAVSNHSYLPLLSARLVAELWPTLCSQLGWVMAIRLPQICRNWCMGVGFTQLLRMTSLQTFSCQGRIVWYVLQRTGKWTSISIAAMLNSHFVPRLLGWVTASSLHRSHSALLLASAVVSASCFSQLTQ